LLLRVQQTRKRCLMIGRPWSWFRAGVRYLILWHLHRSGGRVRRRGFITLFGGAAAWPLTARAQQSSVAKLPRIGFLSNGAGEHALNSVDLGIFTELRRLGWVNGRSAIYELRFSAGDPSRWPGFVADLVDRKVNVIFAGGHPAAKAAKIATATIPIVALADD